MIKDLAGLGLFLFDKTLDMLYAFINSAHAQMITHAQKVAKLETRLITCENSLLVIDNTMSQRQNAEDILKDKLEDLENRKRCINLHCVGVPEDIVGDSLIQFLVKDLLKALQHDLPKGPLIIEKAHQIGPS